MSATPLSQLRALIADDAYAITFQTYQAAEIPRHEVIVVGRWNVDSRTPEI